MGSANDIGSICNKLHAIAKANLGQDKMFTQNEDVLHFNRDRNYLEPESVGDTHKSGGNVVIYRFSKLRVMPSHTRTLGEALHRVQIKFSL